ncbi:hypothetical protein P692DRAFT_20826413, partial [Suillus brevipes Sb2]
MTATTIQFAIKLIYCYRSIFRPQDYAVLISTTSKMFNSVGSCLPIFRMRGC